MRLLSASTVLLLALGGDPGFVWWEGESPRETNFGKTSWFAASTFPEKREEVLSGGDWLSSSGKRTGPEAFARYRIDVPARGEYSFWTRKFWKHGPFRWRFDKGEWRTCGRDVGLADSVPIRTHLVVNWVFLGTVRLSKGKHDFELRLLAGPGEELTACFDCFLLTRAPFVPRGKLKPGERSGKTEPGWWALEPPPDPFGEAVLDLRFLNEPEAGAGGFVRRDGDRFLLGDGTPVRFWAVNCGPDVVRLGRPAVAYLARRLARSGVNMVRFHGPVFDRRAKDPAAVDADFLDRLHYFISAMKSEGIYTTLSFYFPLWFDIRPGYGIEGYEGLGNKKPFALLFFDPEMQRIYRSWARALLATKNPYTGLPPAKDPAVAIVEIVNEDSYLFHTFNPGKTIPLAQMEKLERAFGDWLRKRYGTLEKTRRAWRGADQARDVPKKGRMALLPAWNLTERGHGEGARRRRASDQLRFLTEHMRGFYTETAAWFREELGLESLVSASNWKTADPRLLDALERYVYTAGDVIDRHGYFGGRHEGEGASYSVRAGHSFADRAGVLSPAALPVQAAQVDGFPQIVSEIGWTNPNRFRADFPFLAAAYGSLQGIDGIYFFAVSGPGWDAASRKFPLNVPTVLGQFPACALLYRRGDVPEADPVVREVLRLEDLYDFRGSALVAPPSLDALRKADVPPDAAVTGKPVTAIDPFAFFVGRVVRRFGGKRSASLAKDLRPFVDREKKAIRSLHGHLRFEYGNGLVTLDTPRAQGVTGFLSKAGRVQLADVVIESENEYGSVLVVSLDGRPLATSERILIQAVTEEKPYGFRAEDGRIRDLGGYPMLVRNVRATVTLKKGARLGSARVLDAHGYARGKLGRRTVRRDLVLRLPPDSLYTFVE